MARYKSLSKKLHLGKAHKHTRWAPFWLIFRVFGIGKKIHPARITRLKRSWRRTKLKIKPRRIKQSHRG